MSGWDDSIIVPPDRSDSVVGVCGVPDSPIQAETSGFQSIRYTNESVLVLGVLAVGDTVCNL